MDASSPVSTRVGATIDGRVQGHAGAVNVTIVGTERATPTDAGGRFRFEDVTPGSLELRFQAPGADTRVALGAVAERERIELTVSIEAGSGVLAAVSHLGVDGRADVRGVITAIDASARRLQVGSTLVSVPSTATIKDRGVPVGFDSLRVGQRVHIQGGDSGVFVTAREVEIEERAGDDQDADEAEAEFKGTVTAVAGACPGLTMTVGGRSVMTTGATVFLRTTCASLAAGQVLEIKGTAQPDGTVLAIRVQLEDEDEDQDENEAEFRGTVTALSGSCPGLTMTVAGRNVTTDGSTLFERGACAAVRTGTLVQIKGVPYANGSVRATRVRVED